MKRLTIPLTIEIDVEVDVLYTAGRPAPVAFDHDSPAFSDPGDSPEVILREVRIGGDKNILPNMDAATEENIRERVLDHLENQI